MDFWVNILEKLRTDKTVALLYVIDHEGSSPGRSGFHMMVASDGEMEGSIGGGIMEHKLVELARSLLQKGRFDPFIKKQVHQSEVKSNRSGMICSGSQTIAFYFLEREFISPLSDVVEDFKNNVSRTLELTGSGILFKSGASAAMNKEGSASPDGWHYQVRLGFEQTIYIIGAGHVGLALSRIMHQLGFYIVLMDDRPQLNTFVQNTFAHDKQVVDYNGIDKLVESGPSVYVAVVTFGYRSDELCIRRLMNHDFAYFGVMGSASKMTTMFESLLAQGYDKEVLDRIYTPIGIRINSQTPIEIAISIAAQIIAIKNAGLAKND